MYECLVCKKNQKKYFNYKKFNYYRCPNCKLVSTYPLPSKSTIINHYKKGFSSGNYKIARKYENQYINIYINYVNELEKLFHRNNRSLNNIKVLDIGCFTGDFLYLMSKRGAKVRGIELQKEAVKIANKKLPGKIISENIDSIKFGNEKFDVITMFGLIEHLEKPELIINTASKILKKDGFLMMQTPNSGSFLEKLLGKYWPPYSPIEHIHLFTRRSITIILRKNNFEIIKYHSHYKILPLAYGYNILKTFGPEFKGILDKTSNLYDFEKSNITLPIYIGEMLIIAKKNS